MLNNVILLNNRNKKINTNIMKTNITSKCGKYTARINTNSICNKNKIIIFSNYSVFDSIIGIREAVYDFSTESIKEINFLFNFDLPFIKLK